MIGIRKAAGLAARPGWLWRNRSAFACHAGGETPRLLVDVSVITGHDAGTGIQRVVRAVWSELIRRSGRDFVVVPVYATATVGYCYAPFDFLSRKPSDSSGQPVSAGRGDTFLGLDLAAHLLPKYRQQIRAWRRNGAKVHVVVYDVLPLTRPEWFSSGTVRHFRKWFEVLARETDQAICISDKVVRDLRRRLERSKGQSQLVISRIPMGGDISASVPSLGIGEPASWLLERIRFRSAVLMVGTIEPRKGYDVALAAFEHLWRTMPAEAPDLLVIGNRGWKTEALQRRISSHPENGRRLYWLQGVSDEALCRFYKVCRCLLMTSYDEGFGLPLIEASAHGRPILARNLSVFREQGLPNAIFFDDDRPEALAARLMDLLADSQQPRATADRLPTWSECVDKLLAHIGLVTKVRGSVPALRKAS